MIVLSRYFKLSAVYAIASKVRFDVLIYGSIDEVLNLMSKLGYDGIEYNIDDPFKVNVSELRRKTRNSGLEVSAISTGLSYLTYGYSLSSSNNENRSNALRFFRKYIELSNDLGSRKVVIGLARGKCEGDCSKAEEVLRSSLEELNDYAKLYDTILVLEPLNHYETDLINTVNEALNIIKGLSNVKMLLDTYHVLLEEKDPYSAIEQAGPHIGHVHVADSNRYAPGLGILDWEKILFKLLKVGYRGFISVEARVRKDFEELLRVSANTLKPLLI